MKIVKSILIVIVSLNVVSMVGACSTNDTTLQRPMGEKSIVLHLKGYSSECCVGLVAYTLNEMEGVIKHESNVKAQQVEIWYDTDVTSESEIVAALNKTPYKVLK